MNKKHFKTYLKDYILALYGNGRFDIKKIYKASFDMPRLKDPILLYIAINHLEKHYQLDSNDYALTKKLIDSNFNYDLFEHHSYKKIYTSYLNKVNVNVYDCDTKERIRNKILAIKQEKELSNYYIYKTLKLNPGNTNSFLRNGEIKKLSLNDTIRVLRLVENY